MRCHACDVAVGDDQRFCHECGEALSGVTDPTAEVDLVTDAEHTSESTDQPTAEILVTTDPSEGPVPLDPPVSASITDDASVPDPALQPTEAIDQIPGVVTAPKNSLDAVPWHTDESPVTAYAPTDAMVSTDASVRFGNTDEFSAIDVTTTDQIPTTVSGDLFDGSRHEINAGLHEPRGFKLRASFVFALLAMVAALMASVADVIDLRTSVPIDGIAPGIRTLDDVGTNLAIGGYIGVALMLVGGFAACFGIRWGAGIAGGSGLAVTGWAALTIGLVERPLFSAETTFRESERLGLITPGAILTTTRDLGWFLLFAVGILGGIVFLMSLRQAGTGGRRGLNPWFAALGALGSVVLAAGPLIPLGGADLASNLGFDTEPRAFFLGRLIQVGLVAFTGVVGLLSVRTYGLGLATGGMSITIWLWVTAVANLGTGPIGPAFLNLGSETTTPHAVTGVGVAVAVLMLAITSTIAVVTRPRTT